MMHALTLPYCADFSGISRLFFHPLTQFIAGKTQPHPPAPVTWLRGCAAAKKIIGIGQGVCRLWNWLKLVEVCLEAKDDLSSQLGQLEKGKEGNQM